MVNFLLHGWMNSVEREELWLLLSQLLLVLIKICVFVRFSRRKLASTSVDYQATALVGGKEDNKIVNPGIRTVDTSKNKTNSTYWVES